MDVSVEPSKTDVAIAFGFAPQTSKQRRREIELWLQTFLFAGGMLEPRIKVTLALLLAASAVAQGQTARKVDQGVDAKIYNGFRRYHAGCNHCHGPDGMGSTIGPSLVDRLPDIDAFRVIVRGGTGKGTSVMQGFADDPNVGPYIDDIYAYLKARADGTLGRGRPVRRE